MNAVSQCAEPALIRQESDGPQSLHIIPYPNSQPVLIRGALHGTDPDIQGLPVSADREDYISSVDLIHGLKKIRLS